MTKLKLAKSYALSAMKNGKFELMTVYYYSTNEYREANTDNHCIPALMKTIEKGNRVRLRGNERKANERGNES